MRVWGGGHARRTLRQAPQIITDSKMMLWLECSVVYRHRKDSNEKSALNPTYTHILMTRSGAILKH